MFEHIDIGFIIIWFVVFLFSLSLHESAHAWTSEKFGDDTGRHQGRITLNPIRHIDPIGTIALPLIMMFTNAQLLGWARPVQTNPLMWRDKTKASICVAAAGPASNFILMTVAFIILKVLVSAGVLTVSLSAATYYGLIVPAAGQSAVMEPITMILSVMLFLNLTLGVFNFIPIPPLDGSHVLEALLPYPASESYAQIRPYGFILLIALLYLGVFGMILNPISKLVYNLLFA